MEKCALGCLLLATPDEMNDYAEFFEPSDFYDLRHRSIFNATIKAHESGATGDILLVDQLMRDAEKAKPGDISYLAELQNLVPASGSFYRYAPEVKTKATLRRMAQSLKNGLTAVFDHEGDPESLIDSIEASVMAVRPERKGDECDVRTALGAVVQRLEQRASGARTGLPTGFANLDHTTELRPSEMFVIAARPSMGKTSFALSLIEANCPNGVPVGIISLEMDRGSLMERLIAMVSEVNLQFPKDWTEHDKKRIALANNKVRNWRIWIDDRSSLTIGQIRAQVRRWVSRYGVKLVIVDYLQLVAGVGKDRREAVDGISRGLKGIAKELKIPIVVLAQLNREIEKSSSRRPKLSDLRESGQIEQDADVVGMLWAEEEEPDPTNPIRNVNMDIVKQRNGATGTAKFEFHRRYTLFKQRYTKIEP
jgi:replicative DNA helicase